MSVFPVKKRVVIAGGTGLIGSALTAELSERGYHVIATGTHTPGQSPGDGVTLVEWNGRDTDKLVPYLEDAAAVINLVGSPVNQRWTDKGKENIVRSRIESGSALAASIRKTKKKPLVLIQASAIGFYGDTGDTVVTEETPAGSNWLSYVCTHWEAATESVERSGVRRCIIRSAPVLARGGFLVERVKPFRWMLGGPVGNRKRWVSWIALHDEIAAILFFIQNKKTKGVYNLSSPKPVYEEHFARALGEAIKRPSWLSTPSWMLALKFGREQREALVLTSNRVQPERLLKAGFRFTHPDLEGALERVYKR